MELGKYIAETIKTRRLAIGMSKHELVRQTGITYTMLTHIEREGTTSVRLLSKILPVLGLTLTIQPAENQL